jgi:FkbM family methyltransferase
MKTNQTQNTTFDENIGLHYRESTWDYNICLEQRHYLPLDIKPDSVVLDLGAHIGSFAKLCIELNAKQIYCFEAARDNYNILKKNATIYPQIIAFHRIVTSHPKAKSLTLHHGVGINTGMHSVFRNVGGDSERVNAFDFKKSLTSFEPDFLKCDIEGSEYFLNWKQALSAHKPKRMVIEYHLDLPTFRNIAEPTHQIILDSGYKCYKRPDFTHAHQTFAFYEAK